MGVPVAMQMMMAAQSTPRKPLVIIAENKGESANMKTVKSVINKMVVYDPKKRISAAEAAHSLEFDAGKTLFYFDSMDRVGTVFIGNECRTKIAKHACHVHNF